MLDEPTNHLDIPAREALQEVLENYPGTILLVSHDRYLIDRLATQVWELQSGRLECLRALTENSYCAASRRLPSSPGAPGDPAAQTAGTHNSKETRQRTQAIAQLEERIRQQESAIQRLSVELQKAGQAQAFERMHSLSCRLPKHRRRWTTW